MSRIKFIVVVLLQCVFLQSEIHAQSQAQGKKAGTSTISGRVTLKGEPFRNATVTLHPEQSSGTREQNAILQVRTDQLGMYQITGVVAGRYKIAASAPGFATHESTSFGQRGTTLNIGESENIEKLDLELKRGGVITGRITDANNRPLVEEVIQLMKLDQKGNPQPFILNYIFLLMGTGSTDDRGVYRIFGLPAGRYLVYVRGTPMAGNARMSLGDKEWPPTNATELPGTFHPAVTDPSLAKVIEVGEGSETVNVDITIAEEEKAYNILGRVVIAENGQPVKGVEIAYGVLAQEGTRINAWDTPGIRSDKNGEFRLQGMIPGKYGLFARSDQENGVYSEIEVCEVHDRDLPGVEIKVRLGGSISGVVVIEGTNDPAVLANATQIQLVFSTRTTEVRHPIKNQVRISPEGNFYVRAIQPGKVDVQMAASRGFSILRIERNGGLVSQQEGMEISPGEEITDVRVVVGYRAQEENR